MSAIVVAGPAKSSLRLRFRNDLWSLALHAEAEHIQQKDK
jgi:hypothetical protein